MKSTSVFIKLLPLFASVLVTLLLIGLQQTFAAPTDPERVNDQSIKRPASLPTNVTAYRLPFDRRYRSIITNGRGEGAHINASAQAIDFSPGANGWSTILAAKSGTVYINGSYTDWGNLIIIAHNDGTYSWYAHMNSAGFVGAKTPVSQGQAIGVVGQSGSATAVHLHFEARTGMSATPTPSNPNSGTSANTSVSRIRGIGWFPWWPNTAWNSGYTVVVATPPAPNQCTNRAQIEIRLPPHSGFIHSHTEAYSADITQGSPSYVPASATNVPHGYAGAFESFAPQADTKKYFVHLRAYDATANEWALESEIAHQGPYKIGLSCPSTLDPDYNDEMGDDEP